MNIQYNGIQLLLVMHNIKYKLLLGYRFLGFYIFLLNVCSFIRKLFTVNNVNLK